MAEYSLPGEDNPMSREEAERRIAELEEQLRRAREEASWYKEAAYAFLRQIIPDEPLTEEELNRMLTDTSGTPIRDIIAELERAGQ
jgi:hypothetical protein